MAAWGWLAFGGPDQGTRQMPHVRVLPTETAVFMPGGVLPAPVAGAVRAGARVYVSAAAGVGDATAQTDGAMDAIGAALAAAGAGLSDLGQLRVALIDRAHQADVLAAIARRLPHGVAPAVSAVVFAGLPMPEQVVQITADAVVGGAPPREVFTEEAGGAEGHGRTPADAAEQTDRALNRLATQLAASGSSLSDVCKITVQITDRAHRIAVYNTIGRHFRGIHPVSTGLIVTALSHPDSLVAIDTHVLRGEHRRLRQYHTNAVRYGFNQQPLDCDFCMAVRTGSHVVLRGQTGTDLAEAMHGAGDAAAQAEQAMQNVGRLLNEAGAALSDVVRATVYVTDRAYLAPVTQVVMRHLSGVAPTFRAVIVKGLASPDLLMEVDITAEIGG
jgi:enamine deaminase RidA (YjgF/YER057c/UK114 family)